MHPLALFQFTHDFYIFFLRLQSCQLGDKVLHKYIFLVAAAHCALTAFYTIFPELQPVTPVAHLLQEKKLN